jgi:NADPH-dependent 2,4-dienoyl-CoA reductase/sulfur reductase-like enzyme
VDCVIIGAGVAGMQAALEFRLQWPEKTVTLIDTEKEVGYYRTLLPQFMNRSMPESKLFFWRNQDDPLLDLICGVAVEGIDRENRTLWLSNKQKIQYRRLIIASGGRPIVPAVCASDISGIFPLRSLTTARAARDWLPEHPQIVILGGGLVGVKTAAHLAGFKLNVTLIEKEHQLLPQALSAEASRLVEAHLRQKNIGLLLGSTVEDIQTAQKAISGVLVNGQWLPCQTLLVAAGSVPDVEFLNDSGLLQDCSLEVTTALQTTDRNIFAAGDAVTIVDSSSFTPWTWPQAVVQGKLAAANLYAPVTSSLSCLSRVNSMNLNGISLVVIGIPVPGAQRSVYAPPETGVHRELFHAEGRIVGGALIGDISNAGRLHWMMNIGKRIETDFDELLEPRIDAFSRVSPSCTKYNRRVVLLPHQGA